MTDSIRGAIEETERRRAKQLAYNASHGITPETIVKSIEQVLGSVWEADYVKVPAAVAEPDEDAYASPEELEREIIRLEKEMRKAARSLEFERAAALRDRIRYLRQKEVLAAPS